MYSNVNDNYHFFLFFFFSSRRRHTRLQGDWSSDVCSSDLIRSPLRWLTAPNQQLEQLVQQIGRAADSLLPILIEGETGRSEERRVGKECRSRWSPYH